MLDRASCETWPFSVLNSCGRRGAGHSGDVLAAGVLTDAWGEGPHCAEMH